MDDPVLAALERDESYRIVHVLAEKPSGRTELVVPPAGSPLLVRKRIPIALANDDAWARLSVISDPHLPRVIETYRLPDQFVVVCEYVEGESAAQLVARIGALEPEQALPIVEGVCTAAGVLHAYGIIHRDITPSNVIIRGGEVHLIDLGIARVGDMTARHDTTRLGTWGFAAPEQYGFAQTDARSDVYSIGCLAAFLLTGTRPDAEGFDDAVAGLADPLRTCIDKARSFEPSARYASTAELGVAFAEAVTDARSIGQEDYAVFIPAAVSEQAGSTQAILNSAQRNRLIELSEIADAWHRISVEKKLIAGIIAICLAFFNSGMIAGAFDLLEKSDVPSFLGGLSIAFFFAWLSIEILMLFIGAGPYDLANILERLTILARRCVIPFLACILSVLFFGFISVIMFGGAGQ